MIIKLCLKFLFTTGGVCDHLKITWETVPRWERKGTFAEFCTQSELHVLHDMTILCRKVDTSELGMVYDVKIKRWSKKHCNNKQVAGCEVQLDRMQIVSRKMSREYVRRDWPDPQQDYKSLPVTTVICDKLVNTQTHRRAASDRRSVLFAQLTPISIDKHENSNKIQQLKPQSQ